MGIIYGKFCPQCGFGHNAPATQEEHATEKQCNTCGQVKALEDFPRNNGSWDGHRHTCNACVAQEKQVKRQQDMAAKAAYARDEKQLWMHGYRKQRIQRYEIDEYGDELSWEERVLFGPDGKPTSRGEALAALNAMQDSTSGPPSADVAPIPPLPFASHALLPPLKGSARQIHWASSIRQRQLARTRPAVPLAQHRGVMPDALERFAQLSAIESAHWWIDHRDDMPLTLLSSVTQAINQRLTQQPALYGSRLGSIGVRADAIQRAKRLLQGPTLFFDLETTGLEPDAAIVEIAIARETGEMVADTLVNPKRAIPADATAIHHITDAMVAAAPTFDAIWPELCVHFQHAHHLAAHNASFDMRIMRWQAHALHVIDMSIPDFPGHQPDDTMRLYADYSGLPPVRTGLNDACHAMGIIVSTSHRAADDVRNMLELVRRIAQDDGGEYVPL